MPADFLQQNVLTVRTIFCILSFAPFHMGGGKGANVCGEVATPKPADVAGATEHLASFDLNRSDRVMLSHPAYSSPLSETPADNPE